MRGDKEVIDRYHKSVYSKDILSINLDFDDCEIEKPLWINLNAIIETTSFSNIKNAPVIHKSDKL